MIQKLGMGHLSIADDTLLKVDGLEECYFISFWFEPHSQGFLCVIILVAHPDLIRKYLWSYYPQLYPGNTQCYARVQECIRGA
jgi:hypothetical protein